MSGLAACAPHVAPGATDLAPAQTQRAQGGPQGEPQNCHEFTAPVMVGGQPQQALGQACQQPDGSWQITLNTPGLPQQVYTLPPQAIYMYPYTDPYYSWWDPWFYGTSLFVGGPVFRFHHHDGFHHGGLHGGFRHGGFHGGRR
jgi:hypothetical protein